MKNNPTQKTIAAALGVTQQYVSKLARNGMPTTSVSFAKSWLKNQSEKVTTTPATGTLTEARMKKLNLECCLLQARIDREADTTELLKASEMANALKIILHLAQSSINREADGLAQKLEGLEIAEIYKELKLWGIGSLIEGCIGMVEKMTVDHRLRRIAESVIEESIVKFRSSPAITTDA